MQFRDQFLTKRWFDEMGLMISRNRKVQGESPFIFLRISEFRGGPHTSYKEKKSYNAEIESLNLIARLS
ncbi:hypothetical protein M413DRAFT_145787 [Hebeloma cylindrosporum]|uniref:Uncharacterized protein n=1 Tax=Hebeloma cylindrosporum TaxID=76867 RepID=A0A0C3BXH0_HEBCY|nr:hypothetical protein M413DRAFT_145787 [Hebeloma cylindrosporum h7]